MGEDVGAFLAELRQHALVAAVPEPPAAQPIRRPERASVYARPTLHPLDGTPAFAFA